MLTLGHAVAGSIAEAQAAYAEASALARRDARRGAERRVDAAAYLCSAATYLDRYDEAVAHAERALRLGRAAGHLHPTLIPALGAAHFMRGRLAEAAKVLDAGVEAARLAGITQSMAWMLRNRALPSAMAGELAAALEHGRGGAGAHAAPRRERPVVLGGDGGRAGVGDGRPQPARRRRHRRARRRRRARAIPGAWRVMGLEALTTAYVELDRGDEAARSRPPPQRTRRPSGSRRHRLGARAPRRRWRSTPASPPARPSTRWRPRPPRRRWAP